MALYLERHLCDKWLPDNWLSNKCLLNRLSQLNASRTNTVLNSHHFRPKKSFPQTIFGRTVIKLLAKILFRKRLPSAFLPNSIWRRFRIFVQNPFESTTLIFSNKIVSNKPVNWNTSSAAHTITIFWGAKWKIKKREKK